MLLDAFYGDVDTCTTVAVVLMLTVLAVEPLLVTISTLGVTAQRTSLTRLVWVNPPCWDTLERCLVRRVVLKSAEREMVRTFKRITAREMWEQHEPFSEEYLWGGGFWERSYYLRTVGTVSTETIERYIERTEHI